MRTIGFIGVGTMGRPMAVNLLKAGFPLVVHDLAAAPVEALVRLGAGTVASPADVARATDVVITMLPSSPQVEEVYLGRGGLLEGVKPRQVLIDMSTIDPGTTERVAERAAAAGARMLDAPVSGAPPKAADGTLTIMVGGDAETLAEVRDILGVLGTNVIHVGSLGMGEVVKLCNNLIAGVTMVAVAEAFGLGQRAGVDPKVLYDVIRKSSGNCWILETRPPLPGLAAASPAEREFEPGFMTDLMHKDLGLALAAGQRARVPLPLCALTRELYGWASARGLGRKDFSAVFKLFEQS